jgi:hypothetical protein
LAAGRSGPLLTWLGAHAGDAFFLWVHDLAAPDQAAPPAGSTTADLAAQRADALVGELLRGLATLKTDNQLLVILTATPTSSSAASAAVGDDPRVPLLVAGPIFPPAHVDAPVEQLDILPTVVALAGLPAPPDSGGTSLVPLLRRR